MISKMIKITYILKMKQSFQTIILRFIDNNVELQLKCKMTTIS